MSTVPSSRQNPDEFHGLNNPEDAENHARGKAAAKNNPEEGQTGNPTVGHGNQSPNYGEFGNPETATGNLAQAQPPLDDTHHGDERFRNSGTRNWETNEPKNPHQGAEE